MKQPRTNTISASLRAAILGVAVAFLIVPGIPAMANNADAPKLVSYAPEGMPGIDLGEVESLRKAYLNQRTFQQDDRSVDDSTSSCLFGFCFKCGIHGAHHSFNGVKRRHIQITTWKKGVKGSGRNRRYPIPFC